MGTIKVILKKDIQNLGEEGDIKIVKRGYARNYLVPNGLVCEYSKHNLNVLEAKKDYYEKRKLAKRENSTELKAKLEQEKIVVTVPAGEKGRLYGTVTSANLADALNKLNYVIEKKQVELKDHVKFVGAYSYRIHLYQDIYAEMKFEVVAEKEPEKEKNQKGKKRRGRKNVQDQPVEENVENVVSESAVTEENTVAEAPQVDEDANAEETQDQADDQ